MRWYVEVALHLFPDKKLRFVSVTSDATSDHNYLQSTLLGRRKFVSPPDRSTYLGSAAISAFELISDPLLVTGEEI
jgi:hypothetical protein